MAKEGWIKVFRQMQDCWVWDDKPYAMGQAWVDLLLLTEHSESKKSLKGKPIIVKRGQYLTSVRQLGDRWGWSRTKVLRFLQLLVDDQMIVRESDSQKTLINIVNYGIYQDSESKENDTEKTRKRQQSDTDVTQNREKQEERTKEEVNRDNQRMEEEKNIYIYKESNDSLCQTQVRQVVDAWNSLGISKIKKLSSTTQRYKMLTARINEYGIDDVLAAVEKVRESDFLKGGGNKGWVIDFGWFVRPNNFPAILEGKYDNRNIKDNSEEQKGWQSW